MSSLNINIPHQLSQEEALSRIKNLLGKLKEEQKDKVSNVTEEWKGDTGNFSFTTYGYDLSGSIKVHPSSIDIDATVPFAIALFKGTIKEIIDKKTRALLS